MRRNNLYLEKIIKKAIIEQDEVVPPPPKSSDEVVPAPPVVYYRIVGADGNTDPNKYTAEQLKSKNLTADSLVYNKSLGDWKPIKDVPELSGVISGGSQQKSPQENTTTETGGTLSDAEKDSFMGGCVDATSARNSLIAANEKFLKQDLDGAADREEANQIYEKHLTDQGDQDKKVFFKACLGEWKRKFPNDARIQKFDTAVNNWMKSTGKDLMNKAFSAGGNILLKLANNALKSKGISLTEDIIKKNTKNHLIEIYNRKNRRRY